MGPEKYRFHCSEILVTKQQQEEKNMPTGSIHSIHPQNTFPPPPGDFEIPILRKDDTPQNGCARWKLDSLQFSLTKTFLEMKTSPAHHKSESSSPPPLFPRAPTLGLIDGEPSFSPYYYSPGESLTPASLGSLLRWFDKISRGIYVQNGCGKVAMKLLVTGGVILSRSQVTRSAW
ncbi:hypothetical protein JTE90_011359 [Oedothorax gibbosus]|uniref:Uncharacterized protein n=1 Tax=Oedothorax gibbosus TaxID=931172 RepID=A0AAV6VKL2_9ARAC|nr:hypothetical protein JTE90_011359 [Oedothorax gibbosus]